MADSTRTDQAGDLAAGDTLLLTAADLARELRVSVRTIRRLHDQGRLPRPIKINRVIRWPRATILEWIRAGCCDRATFHGDNGRPPGRSEPNKKRATAAPTAAAQKARTHDDRFYHA